MLASYSAASKAHLLFSPGVASRTAVCLGAEALLVKAVSSTPALRMVADEAIAAVELRLLKGAHAMAWWSVVALLASSCCALQIILSAASVGCSGLNSVLGPVRPPMLAATALLQASAWHVVLTKKPEQAPPVALGSALTLALTLLPELLHLWETRRRMRRAAAATGSEQTLELAVGGVGCTACESKVRAVAEGVAGVLRCAVDIDAGRATVAVAGDADAPTVREELAAALAGAGYGPAEAKVEACPKQPRAPPPRMVAGAGAARWWLDERLGAIVGGLLGSSCCAVQLALNLATSLGVGVFGVGCAGFNTHLGPLRPYMRAATGTFFAIRWATCPPKRRLQLLLWTLLAAGLTLLPELLLASGAPAVAAPTDGAVKLSLKVDGMGCEACQVAVAGAMQRQGGVLDAAADFSAGTAELLVQPSWGFELASLAKAVEDAGFELDLASAVYEGSEGAGDAAPNSSA